MATDSRAGKARPERMEPEEFFTGWKDPGLTEQGIAEPRKPAKN